MSEQESYQALLSDLVKKQIAIFGPQVALSVARKVSQITVTEDGQVTAISGDYQTALKQLVNEYVTFSDHIAFSAMQSLLEKYPEIKAVNQ